jgi:two-component system NtrC family sensor kinase
VAAGDLSGPVDVRSHDELGELGASLNSMCDQLIESQKKIEEETASRVAAMAQLRHADRLRTVGRLASGVAHELGTPLNVISGRAGLIASDKLNDEQRTQSALTIKAEADRMAGTIRQLLDFARRNRPNKASIDLLQVARQTIELLSPLAEKRKLRLSLSPESGEYEALADVGQVQQVLTNLIVNAMHASSEDGAVEVSIERREATPPEEHDGTPGEYDCIRVEDHGQGIKPEDLDHLFEPFFTTKDVGEGTGLGLSIAYGMVHEHGGWIDVVSEVGKGSCFTVYVPREIAS